MKPTNEIDQKLTQNKEMITLSKLDDSQQMMIDYIKVYQKQDY